MGRNATQRNVLLRATKLLAPNQSRRYFVFRRSPKEKTSHVELMCFLTFSLHPLFSRSAGRSDGRLIIDQLKLMAVGYLSKRQEPHPGTLSTLALLLLRAAQRWLLLLLLLLPSFGRGPVQPTDRPTDRPIDR